MQSRLFVVEYFRRSQAAATANCEQACKLPRNKMNKSIIAHSLNGVTIGQRLIDGYVNAKALCKASNLVTGEKKEPSE